MGDIYAFVRKMTNHELISARDAKALTDAVDGLIDENERLTRRSAMLEAELAALKARLAEKDKEIAELREAVGPFSRLASVLCVGDADDTIVIGVSAGDLRRLVNVRRAAPRCEHCAGSGRVFVCRHWPRCHCTDGVIESDCPGHSATCPECGGNGNAQPVASTNPA